MRLENWTIVEMFRSRPGVPNWPKFGLFAVGVLGTAYLGYRYATPSEEDIVRRLSPELRERYMLERDARMEYFNEFVKEAIAQSKTNEPAWKVGPMASKPVDFNQAVRDKMKEIEARNDQDRNDRIRSELAAIAKKEEEEKNKKGWW